MNDLTKRLNSTIDQLYFNLVNINELYKDNTHVRAHTIQLC